MSETPEETVALQARVGELGALLVQVMAQAEADLSAAHKEICELQGLDPKTHTWPDWSSPANSIRWFEKLRKEVCEPASKDTKR